MVKLYRWLVCILVISFLTIISMVHAANLEPSLVIYDLNSDGTLNIGDLNLASEDLGKNCYSVRDINRDGIVDSRDQRIIATHIFNRVGDYVGGYDLNADGAINVMDLAQACSSCGETSSAGCYDFNYDGRVNQEDADIVTNNTGIRAYDLRYSPVLDVNDDGIIDYMDRLIVAKHFGDMCEPCYDFNGDGIVSENDTGILTEKANSLNGFVINELMIKYVPGTPSVVKGQLYAYYGFWKIDGIEEIEVDLLRTVTDPDELIQDLQNNPSIEFVEKNYLGQLSEWIPNDPNFNEQWSLKITSLPEAWDVTKGSSEIPVAVLDTGVNINHPELAGKIGASYDTFTFNSPDLEDVHGHGTMVAGIIAAVTNNGAGIAGIAPETKIMPVKVCRGTIDCPSFNLAKGIAWAANNGARVINIAQKTEETKAVNNAIDYALSKNIPIFAPVGNRGLNEIDYPARNIGVFAVGSVNSSFEPSIFSNYGPELDILAPGEGILTISKSSGLISAMGTSFAAAHVSGIAALALSLNPTLNYGQVYELLIRNSWSMKEDGYLKSGLKENEHYGYGVLYDFYAVTGAEPMCPDFLGDGVVDSTDTGLIAARYGADKNSENALYRALYNPRFDLVPRGGDGRVSIWDLQYVYGRKGLVYCASALSCRPNCTFGYSDYPVELRMSDTNSDGIINDSDREDLEKGFVGDELIIQFLNNTPEQNINQTFNQFGFTQKLKLVYNVYSVKTHNRNLDALIAQVNASPYVKVVQRNYIAIPQAGLASPTGLSYTRVCEPDSSYDTLPVKITFEWNPVPGARYYIVYVWSPEENKWHEGRQVLPSECTDKCRYVQSDFPSGREYTWLVRAIDISGNYGDTYSTMFTSDTCSHTISWGSKNFGCSDDYLVIYCEDGYPINVNDNAHCRYTTSSGTSKDVLVKNNQKYNWQIMKTYAYCDSDWHEADSGSFTGTGADKNIKFDVFSNSCGQYSFEYCVTVKASLPCHTYTGVYDGCVCSAVTSALKEDIPYKIPGAANGAAYSWKAWTHRNICDAYHWQTVATGSFTEDCCEGSCDITPPIVPGIPGRPELVEATQECSMDNAEDISPVTVTFKWNPATGADYYRVIVYAPEVGRWLDAANTVNSCGAVCSYTWRDFLPGVQYQWKVVAYNNAGSSESETRYLPTRTDCKIGEDIIQEPDEVTNLFAGTRCDPEYAGDTSPVTVTFSWDPVKTASWYEVYVKAPDLGPDQWHRGQMIYQDKCGAKCQDIWYNFPTGTFHIWKVKVYSLAGVFESEQKVFASEKSCEFIPLKPKLLTPEYLCEPEGASDNLPVTVTFKWTPATGVHHYRVYVFKGPVVYNWHEGRIVYPSECDANSCQDTWYNFPSGVEPIWFVKAFGSADETGPQAMSDAIKSDATPVCQAQNQLCRNSVCDVPFENCETCLQDCGYCLMKPSLYDPVKECMPDSPDDSKPVTVNFIWSVTGADHYRVWLWTGPTPLNWITSSQPVHGDTETWDNFPLGTTHTWFVRAYANQNEDFGGVNSDINTFTTPTNCLGFPYNDPNDALYPFQWNLKFINMPAAWKITTGSPNVKIAIVDTGIDLDHSDLQRLAGMEGYNVYDNNQNVAYTEGDYNAIHGTTVTGIVAADTNNHIGIAAVSPNVQVMPIKFTNPGGAGNADMAAKAIEWAANHGARAISISFIWDYESVALDAAINYAHDEKGVAIIAATGNHALDFAPGEEYLWSFPNNSKVLAVGAIGHDGTRWERSVFGREYGKLMVMAPGVNIFTTVPNSNEYEEHEGTSLAAPHVAGLAGLFFSIAPVQFKADDFYHYITTTAMHTANNPEEWNPEYGYGIVDAYALLKEVDCKKYDVNGDKKIDVVDQQLIAFRDGVQMGDALYDRKYDVYPYEGGNPPVINSQDLQEVMKRNGWVCP